MAEEVGGMVARGQLAQALMIHGPAGSGRLALAKWLAAKLLGLDIAAVPVLSDESVVEDGLMTLGHPDFLMIQPQPEKPSIQIEAVRDLTEFLHLHSHQGGARVAVLWPAESMTLPAANSLLKTLEEPPANSVIVLVTAMPDRLPATIISRCHRLRVLQPTRVEALEWLAARADCDDWGRLLDYAGGGPLAALALYRRGFLDQVMRWSDDLEGIRSGRDSAPGVARRWAAGDSDAAIRWLYLEAATAVDASVQRAGRPSGRESAEALKPPLARLREIEDFLRIRPRPLGTEIQLAALLQRWYGGLPGGESR